jgi:hypothetical protein
MHDSQTDDARTREDDDQVDRDTVEGTDPDLTVPGQSDTAKSGGQGAGDRYVDGDLGAGAIGGEIENEVGEDEVAENEASENEVG